MTPPVHDVPHAEQRDVPVRAGSSVTRREWAYVCPLCDWRTEWTIHSRAAIGYIRHRLAFH